MNIVTVSLTTRLRTWLLVAGLTALLVGVGLAVGGGFLYVFVGLAVLMNVAGYWFSDGIALAASRAKPARSRHRRSTESSAISAIANILQFSFLFGHDDEDGGPLAWVGVLAAIIFAPLAAMCSSSGCRGSANTSQTRRPHACSAKAAR